MRTPILAALAAFVLAGPVAAQTYQSRGNLGPDAPPEQVAAAAWEQWDANKDNRLDPREFQNSWDRLGPDGEGIFGDWDANRDGFIDRQEFDAAYMKEGRPVGTRRSGG